MSKINKLFLHYNKAKKAKNFVRLNSKIYKANYKLTNKPSLIEASSNAKKTSGVNYTKFVTGLISDLVVHKKHKSPQDEQENFNKKIYSFGNDGSKSTEGSFTKGQVMSGLAEIINKIGKYI